MSKLIIPNITTLSYLVSCDSYANISNALEIWIKFTSYFSKEEVEYVNKFDEIPIDLIQVDELEKYLEIKKRMKLSKLLIKYKSRDCTQIEHDVVLDYMNNTSLTELVNSRLTEEEKNNAYSFLGNLETKSDLKKYIESKNGNYTELSIYDAYILYIAKEKLYNMRQSELNKKIRNDQIERGANLKKNLIKDFGHII